MNKKHKLLNFVADKSTKVIVIAQIIAKNELHTKNVVYQVDGYDLFMNNNPRRGIALYLQSTLNAQELPDFNKTDFTESLWASFDSQDKRMVLIGVYRSPNLSVDNTQ